jgi:hypothetical protein
VKTASRLGHLPLLLLALLALLAGLWAGLIRLGWNLPPVQPAWVAEHGPLMISGFLGTLVSLERALALAAVIRSRLPYAAPLLTALGSLALLLGLPEAVGRGLMALGSLALVDIYIVINRRQPNWPHAVMGVGALLWFVGNLLWLVGQPIFRAVPWWLAFLVLTVAGERLELARVLLLRRAAWLSFLACGALVVAGLLLSLAAETVGIQLAGLGLLALGAWLLRFDLARRTVRQTGLTRYIALCLLPGYGWLAAAGLSWMIWADRFNAGPWYDAMLHAVTLGFIISMIFGHAPLILPAVTGRALPYQSYFYSHVVLLHAALVLRVIGDLAAQPGLRQWGGLLTAIAILLFLGNTLWAVRRGTVQTAARPNP